LQKADEHFDMTKIIKGHKMASKKGKSKGKQKGRKGRSTDNDDAVDDFKIDTTDNRFTAVFSDKDFSIDPTRPEFKKTREMERLIAERQARVVGQRTTGHGTNRIGAGSTGVGEGVEIGQLVSKIRRRQGKTDKDY